MQLVLVGLLAFISSRSVSGFVVQETPPAPASAEDTRAALTERRREFDVELARFAEGLQGLATEAAAARAAGFVEATLVPYLEDLAELARGASTKDGAATAWLQLVQAGGMFAPLSERGRVLVRAAVAELATHHLDEPRLGELASHLRFCGDDVLRADAPPVLRELIERAAAPSARAEALLALAALLGEGATRGEERLDEAVALLERLAREHGDLRSLLGPTFGEAAARLRFDFEHLTPGGPVPDFEARDVEGRTLRLSEYRGRVVLLDFWGLWCTGCVAQLPHLARLVERHADEPFTLLGIHTHEPEELVERLRAAGVTWRTALDSAQDSLAARWNITGYPTLFLIDAEGILRQHWRVPPTPEVLAAEVERWVAAARAPEGAR